jgi:hypothetical protein
MVQESFTLKENVSTEESIERDNPEHWFQKITAGVRDHMRASKAVAESESEAEALNKNKILGALTRKSALSTLLNSVAASLNKIFSAASAALSPIVTAVVELVAPVVVKILTAIYESPLTEFFYNVVAHILDLLWYIFDDTIYNFVEAVWDNVVVKLWSSIAWPVVKHLILSFMEDLVWPIIRDVVWPVMRPVMTEVLLPLITEVLWPITYTLAASPIILGDKVRAQGSAGVLTCNLCLPGHHRSGDCLCGRPRSS